MNDNNNSNNSNNNNNNNNHTDHLTSVPENESTNDFSEAESSMAFQVLVDSENQRKLKSSMRRTQHGQQQEQQAEHSHHQHGGSSSSNNNSGSGSGIMRAASESRKSSSSVSFEDQQILEVARHFGHPLQAPPTRTRSGQSHQQNQNQQILDRREAMDRVQPPSNHMLTSIREGDSEVEQMAANITHRHSSRLPVTKSVRRKFLLACRNQARTRHFGLRKILVEDLIDLKNKEMELYERQRKRHFQFTKHLGISNEQEQLMVVYKRAVEVSTNYQLYDAKGEEEFFYYEDFVFDYTHISAKWPWMRPGLHQPILGILLYYLMTPIFFCNISYDPAICQHAPGNESPGWVSAMYFASTTLSTVGYGDLTVSKNSVWSVFVGIVFMVWSNFVLIAAYGSAVEQTFSGLKKFNERFINRILKETSEDDFLHKKVRRLRLAMLCQFTLQFVAVNLLGLLAVRIHIAIERARGHHHEFLSWSWMKSLYWAVQTTTTIGYGDITIGEDFRWFNLVYLMVSTYFVGNALSGFASLSKTIDEVSRRTAWQSREVSKAMIEEMQADDHDDKIDQFEFTVASLLQLGKVDPHDITLIMDKFRELCDEEGFIRVHMTEQMEEDIEEQDEYEDIHSKRSTRRHSLMHIIQLPRLSGSKKQDSQKDLYLDD